MYIVSCTVNDYNGLFTGKCCGIRFKDIWFNSNILNGVSFKTVNKTIILEHKTKIDYIRCTTCGATWCADDFTLDFFNLKKLLNYLKNSKHWFIDESPCDVFSLFEKKSLLTTDDINKIIGE
ncbi:MAG: hypothetical protein KGY67_00695 [Candidatus Thermoplasmatota archaeon]|nr:hypothetical protein [Candidatus Thermoplasmatota archaeon]